MRKARAKRKDTFTEAQTPFEKFAQDISKTQPSVRPRIPWDVRKARKKKDDKGSFLNVGKSGLQKIMSTFKRTGKLPEFSQITWQKLFNPKHTKKLDKQVLDQIRQLLLIAGIEPNPGWKDTKVDDRKNNKNGTLPPRKSTRKGRRPANSKLAKAIEEREAMEQRQAKELADQITSEGNPNRAAIVQAARTAIQAGLGSEVSKGKEPVDDEAYYSASEHDPEDAYPHDFYDNNALPLVPSCSYDPNSFNPPVDDTLPRVSEVSDPVVSRITVQPPERPLKVTVVRKTQDDLPPPPVDQVAARPVNTGVLPEDEEPPLDGMRLTPKIIEDAFASHGQKVYLSNGDLVHYIDTMAKEARLSEDRNVPLCKRRVILGSLVTRATARPMDLGLIGRCALSLAGPLLNLRRVLPANGLCSSIVDYMVRAFKWCGLIVDVRHCYCPHLLSIACRQHSSKTKPEVVTANIRPVILRQANLAISDRMSLPIAFSTEFYAPAVVQSYDLNYPAAQLVPVPVQALLPPVLNVDPTTSWPVNHTYTQSGIDLASWALTNFLNHMPSCSTKIDKACGSLALAAGGAVTLGVSISALFAGITLFRVIAMTLKHLPAVFKNVYFAICHLPHLTSTVSSLISSLGGVGTTLTRLLFQRSMSGCRALTTLSNAVTNYGVLLS